MLSKTNKIDDVMTEFPKTIDQAAPIGEVLSTLHQFGVRHLPVLDESGTIVGVVSERDLEFATRTDAFSKVPVRDVMARDPYCVFRGSSVRESVHVMANQKYGCVVIEDDKGHPIGIFTAVDALLLLDVLLGDVGPSVSTRSSVRL